MGKNSAGRLVLWISDRHCVILAAQYGLNGASPINKTRTACFPAGGEAARARRSIYCIARCPAADVLSGKRMGLRESAVAVQARGAAPGK